MGNKESKPKDLKELVKTTKYTEKEIKQFYKDFLKVYPSGHLTRAEFQQVYTEQFPHGDSQAFADNVFRNFDKDGDMKLDFREFMTALSLTQKAGPAEQLKWAFEMYDIDGSGQITMSECTSLIKSVLRMYTTGPDLDINARDLADKIFVNIDKNRDGKLNMKEFIDGAQIDRTLISLLEGKPLI